MLELNVPSPGKVLLPLALTQFIAAFAGSNMNVAINSIAEAPSGSEAVSHGRGPSAPNAFVLGGFAAGGTILLAGGIWVAKGRRVT